MPIKTIARRDGHASQRVSCSVTFSGRGKAVGKPTRCHGPVTM
jgi:hypothetical protein